MNPSLVFPAYLAGLLTFFAPCTFPLVPAYLGFLGAGAGKHEGRAHAEFMGKALLYVAGFTAVFMMMGAGAGLFGHELVRQRELLTRFGGAVVILFGLAALGVVNFLKLPTFDLVGKRKHRRGKLGAFALGAAFAFTWSPCIGPVLASILILAASTVTAWSGALLLFVYALGLSTPFLALAWGAEHATRRVRHLSKHLDKMSFAGGILMVLLGLLMLTGNFGLYAGFVGRLGDRLHIERLLDWQ